MAASFSITTNTSTAQSIGTGSLATDVELIATNGGGAGTGTQIGGTVSFVNSNALGALTVDPAGVQLTTGSGINIAGGSVTLSSGTITGPSLGQLALNVDGVSGNAGIANGGKISITESASTPGLVTLGGATGNFLLSAQGGVSGGNGGSVTFSTQGQLLLNTDASGNVLGSGLSAVVAPQFMNGGGGSLTLTANTFANANLSATTPLIFNAPGSGIGNGGHIRINQLDFSSDLTIGKGQGDVEFIATNGPTAPVAGSATSGTVIVTIANAPTNDGSAKLIVDPTAISVSLVSKTNPNVNGGFIEVDAPTVVAATTVSSKSPLILNASGAGNGNGGVIVFEESRFRAVARLLEPKLASLN